MAKVLSACCRPYPSKAAWNDMKTGAVWCQNAVRRIAHPCPPEAAKL